MSDDGEAPGPGAPVGPPAPDVGVIVVAAGGSTRTGGAELKQFRWIAGKPMLLHSVQMFQQRSDVVMVSCVLPRQYAGDPPPWLFQTDLNRLLVTVGGRERTDSVRSGLDDMPDEVRVILVHDAARPLVPPEVVDRVVGEARAGRGAVPALPVVDTLKRADADGVISGTVERAGLWRAQTPQGFPRAMLVEAYREAERTRLVATDDAALCERLGHPVVVVPGSELAMKVTEEADFERLEALAARRA